MVALTAYAVCSFDEPAEGQKRVAPTEFRLFHSGVNHTAKGDFVFDDVAAHSVMAAYAARNQQVPLMGDYEHQSLATPPMKALASATQFVPAIRSDAQGGPELWATQVQWTDDARKELESGQYRMYSPAFIPDKDGRIAALINFALTNLPASYEIEPLVAAGLTTPEKDTDMDEKELKALKDKVEELGARCEKMNALCLKRLGKSFDDWAKEESDEHKTLSERDEERQERERVKPQLTALTAFQGKVIELTGKTDPAEALGAVALAVTQGQELVALKQKIAEADAKALETEFTTLLDGAVAAGKISPAGGLASKENIVKLKASVGTAQALSFLKGAIPAEPIVQLRAPTEPKPDVALTPQEAQVAAAVGLPLANLQKFKESQRAGG